MQLVKVLCSATQCRFKENDDYYAECNNPERISEYQILGNGHVDLSGCSCSGCGKEGCPHSEHAVSKLDTTITELPETIEIEVHQWL